MRARVMPTHPAGPDRGAMTGPENTPQRYRIVVNGRLTERITRAFEGLEPQASAGRTTLVGDFVDSAALHGTLERLNGLGIDLISVNPIGGPAAPKESS